MAILVELSADQTAPVSGQPVQYVAKISNTGAAAVNIRSITVAPSPAGGAVGLTHNPVLKPADTVQIPATTGVVSRSFQGAFNVAFQSEFAASYKVPASLQVTVVTRQVGTTIDVSTASNVVTVLVQPVRPASAVAHDDTIPAGSWDFSVNTNAILRALRLSPC